MDTAVCFMRRDTEAKPEWSPAATSYPQVDAASMDALVSTLA